MHQLGNILQSEVNLQALLLHLVKIEQLVDKRQESLGVSVDYVQGLVHRLAILHTLADLLPLLLQVLQRSDNQRNRSTDFVGYHGEELQSGITHLLLLLLLQMVEFLLMAALLSLHSRLGIEPDEPADNQQIQNLGRQRPPERRMHHNLELGFILRPHTVVIGSLHSERIGSGRQISVGGTMFVRGNPILIESFQHVGIEILLRRNITQSRKREVEDVLIIREIQLLDVVQRLRQLLGTHFHPLVEKFERGDCHRRHHVIDLYLVRIEGIESLRSTQIHPAVGSQEVGIRQELVAGETIITVEQQRRFARNPLDETLV